MERFNITRHYLKFYNTVHVSALYTIPASLLPVPSLSSFQDLLYSALTQNLHSHPILGVFIEDEESLLPKWKRLKTIDFGKIVRIIDQDPKARPDAWLQAGLRERLENTSELPLWRVIVAVKKADLSPVKISSQANLKFTLAFLSHHVVADGISAAAFHTTFVEALNRLISDPSSLKTDCIVEVPKQNLVPSLEEGTSLPLTFFFLLAMIFRTYFYNTVDPLSWTSSPISLQMPTAPPAVKMKSFSLSPTQVEALVQRCREQKTTVTSAINVLIARQLGVMYPDYKHFSSNMPISLRKFSGHTARDMGTLTSNMVFHYSSEKCTPRGYISCATKEDERVEIPTDSQLWNSARQTRELIRGKTSSDVNTNVALLRYVSDSKPFFLKKLGSTRDYAFEVSNINTIDGGLASIKEFAKDGVGTGAGTSSRAFFDRAWFCAGLGAHGSPYTISVVSVKGGYMNVCLTWESEVVVNIDAEKMVNSLEEGLKGIGGATAM
jgi:hypothetical protein